MDFKSYIRDIENFPKAGVMFKDITPLLKDANALQKSTEALLDLIGDVKVDKVVGMESRGFFFAPLLASHLNAGFVPVRKPGKLPAKKMSQNYDLEYGTDSLEIHEDAIKKGAKTIVSNLKFQGIKDSFSGRSGLCSIPWSRSGPSHGSQNRIFGGICIQNRKWLIKI